MEFPSLQSPTDVPSDMTPVDLRTDFVSRPTPAMIAAMAEAASKPPAFGLRDDPYVNQLETEAARILGKEDSLFCPTCAMANQIAIHIRCRAGESFICDAFSHILLSEGGAAAALSGANAVAVRPKSGLLTAADVAGGLQLGAPGKSRTSLVAIENTHVHSGGRVMAVQPMREISDCASKAGIPVHLDGSRIFNAATSLGVDVKTLTACADSVAVSMNKGLGAPLGAVLAGSKSFIDEAVRVRQMFGGGWRPAGIPAAAALIALQTMPELLAEDHVNARKLASGLMKNPYISVDLDQVQSNIVFVTVKMGAASAVQFLKSRGILALPLSETTIRMVTYHNIGASDLERTLDAFSELNSSL